MQSKAQMALGLHYCGLEVVWGSGRPQHCRGSALRSPEFVAPHRGPTASPGPKAAAAAGLAGLKLLMEPPASARGRPGATETRRPIAGLSSPRAHRERERASPFPKRNEVASAPAGCRKRFARSRRLLHPPKPWAKTKAWQSSMLFAERCIRRMLCT